MVGTIKDEMGWTEQKQMILRRGGKNTQNYTKKDLNDSDNHDGVIIHLETNILESEVKWSWEPSLRTKLVEVMEFWLSYFKS